MSARTHDRAPSPKAPDVTDRRRLYSPGGDGGALALSDRLRVFLMAKKVITKPVAVTKPA